MMQKFRNLPVFVVDVLCIAGSGAWAAFIATLIEEPPLAWFIIGAGATVLVAFYEINWRGRDRD